MKSKTKIIIRFIVLFIVFFLAIAPVINNKYHTWVKEHKKMYCYSMFRGVYNPAFIIDKSNKNYLIDYYEQVEMNPKATPYIKFGTKTLPQFDPVYVLKYSNDSSIAKVVSYYDRGRLLGGSYTTGWVYVKTLHENPPSR